MTDVPQKPRVSIVMGAYNRREFLKLALQSAREELADMPHEIIIIDGGSQDGSLEWLMHQKDVITIIQHNRGEFHGKPIPRRPWGYFMNLGFKIAQAPYILMMSDDTIFHPGAIQNALKFIEDATASGRKLGAVPFYFHDIGHEEPHQYKVHTLFGHPVLNHGIYLRDAFAQVGFADEDGYQFYAADSDICLKLIHAGYEVVGCEQALMLHCPNHPTRYMTTSSAQWVRDATVMLNKWRGIFVDDKTTVDDIVIINRYIPFIDPDNLAARFDEVLALTESPQDAPSGASALNDTDLRLLQIETRLNSVLASVRYGIQQVDQYNRDWKRQHYLDHRPFWRRALQDWRIFAPLRRLKKRLVPYRLKIIAGSELSKGAE